MEVKPHTSLKHRLLGLYYKICRQVMHRRKLYYVDLYSGDGECYCSNAPMPRWEPPFIKSLLAKADKEKLKIGCFFNDLDPDKCKLLREKLRPYEQYLVTDIQNGDANKIYKTALKLLPADEWSIFYLDPFKHSDLSWNTIESISKHSKYDEISKCERKPELIINLMTVTMQRVIQADPESITISLGTSKWKKLLQESKKTGYPIHKLFRDIFIEKLESLGYKTISVEIKQTLPNTNVLYYMVFATTIPNVEEIHKRFERDSRPLLRDKWLKENFKFTMIYKAKSRGDTSLNDFFQ